MIKVLIIEDQSPHYNDIKREFEKFSEHFEVFPNRDNDTDSDLNNKGHLIDIILKPDHVGFEEIIKYYSDIDLFIIDVTLYPATNDRVGLEFLNFLKNNNYRKNKFRFIISSQFNLENIGPIMPDFDADKQYVSKAKWANNFPEEIVRLSIGLFNLDINPRLQPSKFSIRFWEERWWITLPASIEKNIIHRFNLFIFYVVIISTGLFALIGIFSETITQISNLKMLNPKNSKAESTGLLEYVEHMFLYLLPIFIVFSFLSYYKSTIEIKLTGGNAQNIDHKGAMKSLNNSKYILLSSLLSFTIIKIIDKIFEDEATILSLISYGVFVIIIMSFVIIHQRSIKGED